MKNKPTICIIYEDTMNYINVIRMETTYINVAIFLAHSNLCGNNLFGRPRSTNNEMLQSCLLMNDIKGVLGAGKLG